MDQQALTELALAIIGIAAVGFLVHTDAISGPIGLTAILSILGAMGVYEAHRRPRSRDSDETTTPDEADR